MENYGTRKEDIETIISLLREWDADGELLPQDDEELAGQLIGIATLEKEWNDILKEDWAWGENWLVWDEFMGEQRVIELRIQDFNTDLFEEPIKLRALRVLNCTYCDIIDLELSLSPLLEELDCSNNKIEMLELDDNSKLKKLNCSDNRLQALFLEDLVELTHLDCSNNWLYSLDLSDNTKLKEINYENNEDLEEVILPKHLE